MKILLKICISRISRRNTRDNPKLPISKPPQTIQNHPESPRIYHHRKSKVETPAKHSECYYKVLRQQPATHTQHQHPGPITINIPYNPTSNPDSSLAQHQSAKLEPLEPSFTPSNNHLSQSSIPESQYHFPLPTQPPFPKFPVSSRQSCIITRHTSPRPSADHP